MENKPPSSPISLTPSPVKKAIYRDLLFVRDSWVSFLYFFPSACSYVRLFYNTAVVTATAAAIFTNGHTTPYTTQ